jgi:oligosaccharyltransferase complex subunit beta
MRLSIFPLLFSLLGAVAAISASGNRLLVVLEDSTLKPLYSKFWADLECKAISF